MVDQPLVCADCGATFVFSDAEQAFFAERRLLPPKRCKECRRARRRGRITVKSGVPPAFPEEEASGTITAPRVSRTLFPIRCAECGVSAHVPFKPLEGQAVYC